jgi:hypothetical protein
MKTVLKIMMTLVVAMMLMLIVKFINDRQDDYDVDKSMLSVPTYTESMIEFNQGNDFTQSLPFMASAIIDIDGDGVEELFLGGSKNTPDGLFEYKNGSLVAMNGTAGITKGNVASYGAVVLDVNRDSKQDLLVAREDGIWLHTNLGGKFDSVKLDAAMPEGTVPLSIAVADLNRDGSFDMFVAGYIRHDLAEGQNLFKENYGGESRLFVNNGDNSFRDITDDAGLAYKHNTFQSAFLDLDADGLEDLTVVHDTGHIMTYKNLGNMKFKRMTNPSSNEFSYPMGLGITDLGNNGLPDLFFSNVGSTPPNFMIRGDLRDDQVSNWKWFLFKNKGDFKFDDVSQEMKIADYEFSWGGVFEDLNLDGLEDLIVSENYIGLPPHKIPFLRLNGRLLLQTPNGEFTPAGAEAGVVNRLYSISPLTADFNKDGYPDIIHANLNSASKLFMSKGGNANYLKVSLKDNVDSIGATVKVTLTNGTILSRPYVSGEGLCSDSSHTIIFGLANASATKVQVNYLNGESFVQDVDTNTKLVKL